MQCKGEAGNSGSMLPACVAVPACKLVRALQGRRAAQGGSLCKRRNAAMRRPDYLPAGFTPESALDSVALLANRQSYSTRRAPCQPRFWCEREPFYWWNEF